MQQDVSEELTDAAAASVCPSFCERQGVLVVSRCQASRFRSLTPCFSLTFEVRKAPDALLVQQEQVELVTLTLGRQSSVEAANHPCEGGREDDGLTHTWHRSA